MFKKLKFDKFSFIVLILILAGIYLASIPAFVMKFANTVDGPLFYSIIDGMTFNLRIVHQFPYRINMTVLYGIPIPIFYHCTFFYTYYIFLFLFKLIGVQSFNCMIILLNTLTGINMYIASKSIYDNKKSACISTLLYLLIVYRLSDIYSRGAMGESIAFCFVPLLILSVYKIFYGNEENIINKFSLLFIFSLSIILQDHLLTTYLYFIIILVFLIIYVIRHGLDKRVKIFLIVSVLSVLFNAWYIFPIIYNMLFVDYVNPAFYQGESGFSFPARIHSLLEFTPGSFGIGFVVILILLIAVIIYCLVNKKTDFYKDNKLIKTSIVFSLIALFVFLICFEFVSFDLIRSTFLKPFIDVLQFRTRFYVIVFPLLCISAPHLILTVGDRLIKNVHINRIIYIVLIAIIFISPFIYVKNFVENTEFSDIPIKKWNLDYTLTGTKSASNFDYDYSLKSSDDSLELSEISISPKKTYVEYEVSGSYENKFIEFPLFNYPVYKVYDEKGNILKSYNGANNLLKVYLNNNKGSMQVLYDEPSSWKVGNILSLITLLFIILAFFPRNFYKGRQKKKKES